MTKTFRLNRLCAMMTIIVFLAQTVAPVVAMAAEETVPVTETSTPIVVTTEIATSSTVAEIKSPATTTTPEIAQPTSTTSPATSSIEEEKASSTSSEEMDQSDDDELDLGDNQAELDAVKDFTGVVRQSQHYTCGPASLATLLTQLGNDTSEQEVLQYITDVSEEKGVSLLALKIATQKLGSQVILKHWSVEQILSYIKETQDPVLIHDEKKGVGGHFSVIREYDADKGIVELSDTEAGNIKYSIKDFEHIYTGDALVIYEGEATGLLADETTNLSDEIAATIWGKYVPVSVVAADSGNAAVRNAATVFADCTRKALNLATAGQRNAQRQVCYTNLANAIGSNLGNAGEIGFATEYTLGKIDVGVQEETKDTAGQLGVNSIIAILNSKLSANKNLLTNLQSQVAQKKNTLNQASATQYNLKISLQGQISTKNTAYVKAQSQKTLIQAAFDPKKAVTDKLQSEINSGVFVQNGQVFALGAVGNQVSAQSATYAKLSANLTSRLSSLDGQISQAQRSMSSAQSNYNNYNSKKTDYQRQADSAYSSYKNALSSWRTAYKAPGYFSSYAYYKALAVTASATASYWNWQISSYKDQINSLNSQKNNAKNDVNLASAEVARLQRLKAFGDQEIQRKKTVLTTLQNEVKSLQTQLDKANATVNQLKSELTNLQNQYNVVANAQPPLTQSQINQLNAEINSLNSQIATTQSEITAQQNEIANEANFERNMSNSAETVGTQQYRDSISSAVNDGWNYVKNNPGKSTVVLVGAVAGTAAVCFFTAGGCVFIATAGSVASIGSTINGVKVLTTQTDIFGNSVSDKDWGRAVALLPVDIAGTVAGVAGLKSILNAKYGLQTAEKMVAMTASENAEVSNMAKVEIGAVAKEAVKNHAKYPLLMEADITGDLYPNLKITEDGKFRYFINGERRAPKKTIDFILKDGQLKFGGGHSYISNGTPVDYAGEIVLEPSEMSIKSWTPRSGHYKPSNTDFIGQQMVRNAFKQQLGIDLPPITPYNN